MVSRLELSTQELGFIGLWIRTEAAARDTRDSVTRGHTRRSHLRDRDRFFLLSSSEIDVDPTRIVMSAIHLVLYLDTSIDCIACLIR